MARRKSAFDEFKTRSAALRSKLDNLARDLEAAASGEAAEAISGADTLGSELKSWRELGERLLPLAAGYLTRLERLREARIEIFDEQLSRTLRDEGHEVYGETALLIVDGIVHVETSPKKGIAKVNGAQAADLTTRVICERVRQEIDRLRKLVTPPEEMLEGLLAAYEREVRTSAREAGSQVNTSSILFQAAILRQRPAFGQNPIASNYREYPRELFRADLYTLLASGRQIVRGKRFRYASGSDTAGAVFMLVPALGRAAHVGRIWFEAAE